MNIKEKNDLELIKEIFKINKIKDYINYLERIQEKWNSLGKKEKKVFLNNIHEAFYFYFMSLRVDYNLFNEKPYTVYKPKDSMKYFITKQFCGMQKIDEVNKYIDELKFLLSNFTDKHNTERVSKNDIDNLFNLVYQKYPKLEEIFSSVEIEILLFNNTDKISNSLTTPSLDNKHFTIYCLYMKDEPDRKRVEDFHYYVFLHELGHILCWLVTNKNQVPSSFIEETKESYAGLTIDNPDALEVFADSFAMLVMHESNYAYANPFEHFHENHYVVLKKYFDKLINEI